MSHAPCFGWRCFLQSIIPKDFSLCTNTLADSAARENLAADPGWDSGLESFPQSSSYTNSSTAFYKKVGDNVICSGYLTRNSGNVTAGDYLGLLPAGYRPLNNYGIVIASGGSAAFYCTVGTDGNVRVMNVITGTSTVARLDGISFNING